jgi:hypothetical protein
MSALTDTREQIVEALMDAQAENIAQDRLLHNPTPEIDSLREVLSALARPRLSDRERMRLAGQGMHLVSQIARSNAAEREREHASTGAAEKLGRKPMTVKDAARELRAPLGDLANPMIGREKLGRALAVVYDVLDRAPAGLLHTGDGRPRAGIAGELNSVAKTTALAAAIAARVQSC